MNCFAEDHEMLTNYGFMSLDDVLSWPKERPNLLFASYNKGKEMIVYESLVRAPIVNKAVAQEMIEFTHHNNVAYWTQNSDPFRQCQMTLEGESKRGLTSLNFTKAHMNQNWLNFQDSTDENMKDVEGGEAVSGNQVSLMVTSNHDMFCKFGKVHMLRDVFNSTFLKDSPGKKKWADNDYEKRQAGEFHKPNRPGECVKFLSYAKEGQDIPAESLSARETDAILKELGITTTVQRLAFLNLYGYWLGDGSLAFSRDVEKQHRKPHAILYSNETNGKFLEQNLRALNKSKVKWKKYHVKRGTFRIAVEDERWLKLFFDEYASKYKSLDGFYDYDEEKEEYTKIKDISLDLLRNSPDSAFPEFHWLGEHGGQTDELTDDTFLTELLGEGLFSNLYNALHEACGSQPSQDFKIVKEAEETGEAGAREFVALYEIKDAVSAKLTALHIQPPYPLQIGVAIRVLYRNIKLRRGGIGQCCFEHVNDVLGSDFQHSPRVCDFKHRDVRQQQTPVLKESLNHADALVQNSMVTVDQPPLPEGFHQPHRSPQAPPLPLPLPEPPISSAKWLFWWAFNLNKDSSRAIIQGWHVADGSYKEKEPCIWTTSTRSRDELVRLLLHGGYAPRFKIQCTAFCRASYCNYCALPQLTCPDIGIRAHHVRSR